MEDNSPFVSERKRLTEKAHKPSDELIRSFMGDSSLNQLNKLENMLSLHYDLNRELRFPFGTCYGWGFRYASKKTLLLYVFIEERGFCCTISISDRASNAVEAMLDTLMPKTWKLWTNRYPCGENGGWIHYHISSDEELLDVVKLVGAKVPPKKNN